MPKNVALISLSAGGKAVLMLERSETSLILGGGAGEAPPEGAREDDSLDVQVYRKLSDGIPARLTTRVYLKVSGKPRELSVADIMPEHFMPTGMASAWAARLDQDGRLLVQALPGQATVEIAARLDEPLREVKPSLSPQRPQEVWSYEAAPALRTTTVPSGDGMIAVDPRQAGVPADWLSLPALAVSEGARFRVEEHARGQDERENQRLTLQREMWLDFSGKGFFARDRIEGSMRQGWRFDVAQPYALVRADSLVARASSTQASWGGRQLASNALGAEEGLMAALLVTQGADKGLTGVEWRQPQVTLNAGVRLEAGPFARIPVTGWRQTFDEVDVGLYLPYGYHLIAAPGVDKVSSNVWVERWTMLDIFLVAFFTLLSWRLFGVKGGVSAAAYLILAMSAQAAPMQSFAVAVAFVLLHRLTPEGRLRRLFCIGQYLALLGLVVAALAFIPVQIRYALYPQLEEGSGGMAAMPWNAGFGAKDRVIMTPTYDADEIVQPTLAPAAPEDAGESDDQAEYLSKSQRALPGLRSAESSKQMMGHASARQRYIQSTVTQTGGGEPAWSLGQRYSLHWSGPVAVAQDVRLLISPPWLTRFLRVTTVVLLALLIWRLVYAVFPGSMPPPKWPEKFRIVIPPRFFPRRSSAKAALLAGMALAVLFAAALGFSSPAAAEPASGFPSEELLDELKMRLTEAPACSPSCVDVAEARIEAEPRVFRVTLSAHAAAPSTLPLPEPGGHLSLRGVRVDGVAQSVLRFKGENYLALHTGVRRIQIEYVPVGDTASLSFPLLPARVEFAGTGWHAEGIDESRLLSETLNFSRSENAPAPLGGSGTDEVANPAQTQQFSPFVHVQRNIDFDLDWSVTTEVRRIAPVEGGFAFPIPLLAGEHVTTSSVKVQDGRVLAVLAA
ncbi:MAG: hypothetical protein LBI68_01915, partial [Azoarcus sp.]|nr:hypothetical protein [Azoarcus sp.]